MTGRYRRVFDDIENAAHRLNQSASHTLELAALSLLATLYFLSYLPQIFISENIPKLTLPLSMSYASSTTLFKGGLANPAIHDVVGSAALVSLVYPPGLFIMIRAAQLAMGDTILHLNLLLFLSQLLTPILSFLILRRFLGRLWAFLAAWFVTAHSVFIYTIPDFYNQVLMLASLWLLIQAHDRKSRGRIVLAGILCAINVILKHNIGLAWAPAVTAFLFFQNVKRADKKSPQSPVPALAFVSLFAAYAAIATSLFRGWDNVAYFTLPFAIFWTRTAVRFVRKEDALDAAAFLRDAILFAAPFCLTIAVGFVEYAWNIGFIKYFQILFMNSLEDNILFHGVFHRGLLYYGTGGRLDLGNIRKLEPLALWFAPAIANLWLAIRAKNESEATDGEISPTAYTALAITGVFTFFPLESFFNLQTKLFLPFIALAAQLGARTRGRRAALIAAILLCPFALVPLVRRVQHDARLWQSKDALFKWFPGKAGIFLPLPVAGELERSVNVLRSNIHGRFYIIGSSSGDMSMYYRLLDADFANYYLDLREGYLNPGAEEELVRILSSYPFLIVEKPDLDLWRKDPGSSNRTLRRVYAHIADHYEPIAEYVHKTGPPFIGLNDFYVMRRR
ncbi:MAG: glycosyltransferase family 39 protein [Elusimicrobia bacterium]|nr:glycosyltransferase family 39 protein [Elusimicrobiota bacterium]